MKKQYLYNKIENTLCICVQFSDEHKDTLISVYANTGVVEFENRDPNLCEDVDGNSISWQICDDLLEMGLLWEDEESFDVYFEITNDGTELLKQLG